MRARDALINSYSPTYALGHRARFLQLLDEVEADARAKALGEAADTVLGAFHGEPFLNYPPDFADLLRQKIDAQDDGEAATTPVFFESGHAYAREHHGHRIEFRVSHVGTAPDGAKYTAFGWRTDPYSDWEPFDSDDFTGWTDVTGEVAS